MDSIIIIENNFVTAGKSSSSLKNKFVFNQANKKSTKCFAREHDALAMIFPVIISGFA